MSNDVVVVGGGLVGLTLAYELATCGAAVTVIDAGLPGRATAAGAGILSPVTSMEGDPGLWPFLASCGAHYPDLLARLEADGAETGPAGYGVCGILSLSLRPHEDDWYAPFASMVLERSPGQVHDIAPVDAVALFPPLGQVHRVLHAPGSARVDGRGMAAAVHQAAEKRGVRFLEGSVSGIGRAGARHASSVVVDGHGAVHGDAVAVAGGAWTSAMGEWLGCALPVGPTKGQIVHLGVDDETGRWPIVQPLLTHYLVPWPGGRVACGGTFEADAGFSVSVTAAGLHELLRECLSVAPGLSGSSYLETRVGLRPTTPDDHAVVGPVPGWDNVFVASGHGANGLLQGPYSARVLARAIAGSPLSPAEAPLPAGFRPSRFT